MTLAGGDAVDIRRFSDIVSNDNASNACLLADLDCIFFEASMTKTFASLEVRAAFRERWLGRYLTREPHLAFLAFVGSSPGPASLAGYVVGALEDPAQGDRYADIGYFPSLAELTQRFPAHLHINLAPHARGHGLGGVLIERFVAEARASRSPGVHVVTGAASRNTSFYKRNGFTYEHRFTWGGRENVFLGRTLSGDSG